VLDCSERLVARGLTKIPLLVQGFANGEVTLLSWKLRIPSTIRISTTVIATATTAPMIPPISCPRVLGRGVTTGGAGTVDGAAEAAGVVAVAPATAAICSGVSLPSAWICSGVRPFSSIPGRPTDGTRFGPAGGGLATYSGILRPSGVVTRTYTWFGDISPPSGRAAHFAYFRSVRS
jgi:hypothetical protein